MASFRRFLTPFVTSMGEARKDSKPAFRTAQPTAGWVNSSTQIRERDVPIPADVSEQRQPHSNDLHIIPPSPCPQKSSVFADPASPDDRDRNCKMSITAGPKN